MRELYGWIPWFRELCRKIAAGGESELAQRAHKLQWTKAGSVSPLLKYGDENIDPFSFLYTLATGCKFAEGRKRLCASARKVFNLTVEVPVEEEDAFIFPMGVPMNALFHEQGRGKPALLWRLFRSAQEGLDAVEGTEFDAALAIGNVGLPKLTQTLFLINPSEFMPYDDGTRKLFMGNDPGASNWEGYRTAVGRFREAFPDCGLHEVNIFAYLSGAGGLSLGSAAYQVSTNVYGDNVDRWDEFVKANAIISDDPVFSTMPDIALRAGQEVHLILDAKWKRVDATTDDPKHGIQQADVYQLYAYAKRHRCGTVALIYPRNEFFRWSLRYRFFDGVRLLAIPFDVTEPQSSVARAIEDLQTEAAEVSM